MYYLHTDFFLKYLKTVHICSLLMCFADSGDGWQQPSLLRHDSVDSGVAKGSGGGLGSGQGWKEPASWQHHHQGRHGKRGGGGGGERERQGGGHRQRNGNFHPPRKAGPYQDRYSDEERNEDKLKFVEEDFVSVLYIHMLIKIWAGSYAPHSFFALT